jgi:hypothetical protein
VASEEKEREKLYAEERRDTESAEKREEKD